MQRHQVGRGLYACVQERDGLGWSNSGLVVDGSGLVVDSLYDPVLTAAMVDLYAEVRPEPVGRLVNTHHNGDHCWGNQCFPGAEILAHAECAARFADFPPERAAAMAVMTDPPAHLAAMCEAFGEFHFDQVVLTPPTRLVGDDGAVLDLDGRRVELHWLGPAHTAGDLVVWVPDAGVVFAGDLLFHRCTPIGWEGSHRRWIEALCWIEALEPEVVVPGHGPLGGVEVVEGMRAYLEYVWDEAVAGRERGLEPLEAALGIELGPYAAWTEPERLAANVHRVYRELAGAGWDEPHDTAAVMADVAALAAHLEDRR